MDVAFELTPLVAGKLIAYTFGALVHLFLMVLILGQRRLRRLEWLLFVVMAALFMWNSGNLLALNIGLFYGVPPNVLSAISRIIPFLGLMAAAPVLVHLHVEYARQFVGLPLRNRFLVAIFYLPVIVAPGPVGMLLGRLHLDPLIALSPVVRLLLLWLAGSLLVCAVFNLAFRKRVTGLRLARFHLVLALIQGLLAAGLLWEYIVEPLPSEGLGGPFSVVLMSVAIIPGALVGYSILRYNFLDLQVRRNLVYALVAIFGALIYLAFMRRLSALLESNDLLPSVVTETIMIFLLVVFFEPIKKRIDRALRKAFVSEFERVQKLSAEIQEFAKQAGDLQVLKRFVEQRIPGELGLERMELILGQLDAEVQDLSRPGKTRIFPIHRGNDVIGCLAVTPVTSDLSGDQFGALQLLADQMSATLELCQLIAAKVALERELAEKAKMAFLGEMAARIAHNVKNPLSSMKTLVQLLEEDPNLPERVRQDCRLVTNEIDRLNANISQVLRYAKPALDTDRPADLAAVVNRVLNLTRAEAERCRVSLEAENISRPVPVEGGEEAASDIVSNLVVNALEAGPAGSAVHVHVAEDPARPDCVVLSVEDQGGGITAELKGKIFQPFFTTRAGGTGLGLAIVQRRAEEIGGSVECLSPLGPRGGTRFVIRFRAARSSGPEVVKETYALHPDRR